MRRNGFIQVQFPRIMIFLLASSCASFEPGLRFQDLSRPRQPTVAQTQAGLNISVEEFASEKKSRQAFDADLAPSGILALLIKAENNGSRTFKIQEHAISAYMGTQSLSSIGGTRAAGEAANSEYAGKALGWTVAAGPFAILLWPVTIGASAAHTASVNNRIEQHFENLKWNDALLKPNQTAVGFLYFKIPDGVKKLKNLRVEIRPSEETSGEILDINLSLPVIDLSEAIGSRVSSETVNERKSSGE